MVICVGETATLKIRHPDHRNGGESRELYALGCRCSDCVFMKQARLHRYVPKPSEPSVLYKITDLGKSVIDQVTVTNPLRTVHTFDVLGVESRARQSEVPELVESRIGVMTPPWMMNEWSFTTVEPETVNLG